jgi:hypothetical protein
MRLLKVDLALVLLVASAIGMAMVRGRGGDGDEGAAFVARIAPRVEGLSHEMGAWRMVDQEPLMDRTLAILQCRHHINRNYVNEATGDKVLVTVLLGPAGPLVAHSPEVCLSSTQYEMISSSAPIELRTEDGKKLPILRATFRSTGLSRHVLRMYYAWIRPDGEWVAPSNPRWKLGGDSGLIKLQFATVLEGTQADIATGDLDAAEVGDLEEDEGDAVVRFLGDHGAAIKSSLFDSGADRLREMKVVAE